MSEHGRIVGVTEKPLGSTLVGDTPAGATSLTVVDAAEFDDQQAGWLSVNDQVISYTAVNDDTGVITLKSGSTLAAAADEGDKVLLYDQMFQTVAVDKRAQVTLDGPDDNSDDIDAGIALHLVDKIPTGIRGDDGESVILEDDAGDWKIIDVLGLGNPDATGVQFDHYRHAVEMPETQSFDLPHEPISKSEHLHINGIEYDEEDGWSRDGTTLTVQSTLVRAFDLIKVEYAYRVGIKTSDIETIVPFGASGWKYKQIAATDATDYSGAAYDDSAWNIGTAPFGSQGPDAAPLPTSVLPLASAWAKDTRLWLRRQFAAADNVSISLRVEDNCHVYVNGNLIGFTPAGIGGGGNIAPGYDMDVPAGYLNPSGNVLAVAFDDELDPSAGTGDTTYADAQITGRLA